MSYLAVIGMSRYCISNTINTGVVIDILGSRKKHFFHKQHFGSDFSIHLLK